MAQDLRVSSWVLEGSGQWLDDRGLTHGLGVFETMLVVRGEIFNGGSHRRRMIEGCRRLQITEADWSLVESAIGNRAGGFDSDFLRARVMRSAGKGGLSCLQGDDAQTVLSLMPWDAPPESVRVAFAGWSRDERSPLAGIKCLSYAENLLALDLARATPDVDEFLFANSCGYWCEGTTSNGFAVIGGRLVTPSLQSGCLPGTMRVCVMEWAEALGIDCEERSIPVSEVAGATELFLTSAIRGVVPVVGCDGRQLPVGPITTRLRHEWGRRVRLGS